MKRFATLCFAALIFSGAAGAQDCSLRTARACANTNALMWAPGTLAAVRSFLADEPGNFLYDNPRASAASDTIEVLGGPPNDPQTLLQGFLLFTACRSHSCPEKGARSSALKGA